MEKCPGLIKSTKETIVLAVKFSNKTLLNSPEIIKKTLQNPKLQNEIQKILLAEAKRLSLKQQQGKSLSIDDSRKFIKTTAKPFSDIAPGDIKKQILKSLEYKKIKQSALQLQCSYNKSPVGVFVDKNKGWLIIVASGLAIGTSAAMYIVKKGDTVANIATKLVGESVKFKLLGKMTIGAKDFKFEPSTRLLGTTIFTNIKWERVAVKFDLKISAKGSDVTNTSANTEVLLKFSKPLTLQIKGRVGYVSAKENYHQTLVYNLEVGVKYKIKESGLAISTLVFINQTPGERKRGGSVSLNYPLYGGTNLNSPFAALRFGGKGEQKELFSSTGITTQNTFTVGLEIFGRF